MRRSAKTQTGIGNFQPFSGNVPATGHGNCEATLIFVGLLSQNGTEIQISRLVMGRICVGNIVGQHFSALSAKAERFFVNAKCLVETDAHGWPSAGTSFTGLSPARAVPSQQKADLQGFLAGQKPGSVKSGKAFPVFCRL